MRFFFVDYSLYGSAATKVSSCSQEAIHSHSSLTKPASQSNNPAAALCYIKLSSAKSALSSQTFAVQFVGMLVVVNTSPVRGEGTKQPRGPIATVFNQLARKSCKYSCTR